MNEKAYLIYLIKNSLNNKYYIGLTSNYQKRYNQHIYESQKNHRPLYKSIRKYGIENFVFDIALENLTLDEANYWEHIFIKAYKSHISDHGYNLTYGGSGIDGFKFSSEVKEKLRQIRLNQSEETRKKIGEKSKGRKLSEESKKKMSISQRGKKKKPLSQEQKDKISESLRGKDRRKYLGIYEQGPGFAARFSHKGKKYYVGFFMDKEEALKEIKRKKEIVYGITSTSS